MVTGSDVFAPGYPAKYQGSEVFGRLSSVSFGKKVSLVLRLTCRNFPSEKGCVAENQCIPIFPRAAKRAGVHMPVCRSLIIRALMTLLIFVYEALAQSASLNRVDARLNSKSIVRIGLITSRLSRKQFKRWKQIERLVFAEDSQGRSLHPTLRCLWLWAETSTHAIYVELPEQASYKGTNAGHFKVEKFDPAGKRHVASIRLRLSVVDMAVSDETVGRSNGFIPFYNLRQWERYAEVVGHELAHAHEILSDLKTAKLAFEVVEQTNSLLTAHYQQRAKKPFGQKLMQKLIKRDSLLREFEAHAEAVEEIVWDELIKSQEIRAGSSRP